MSGRSRQRHRRRGGVEAVEPGVVAEKAVDVPQLQRELAAQLLRRTGAEIDVVGRIVPADTSSGSGRRSSADTCPIALALGCRFSDRNRSSAAPSKGMELPFDLCIGRVPLVAHQAVAEQHLERRALLHHRAHGQDGVEPVAELAGKALGDEVGREPLLPLGAIACCSPSSNRARCRRRARDCRRRGCATSGCRSSDCGS